MGPRIPREPPKRRPRDAATKREHPQGVGGKPKGCFHVDGGFLPCDQPERERATLGMHDLVHERATFLDPAQSDVEQDHPAIPPAHSPRRHHHQVHRPSDRASRVVSHAGKRAGRGQQFPSGWLPHPPGCRFTHVVPVVGPGNGRVTHRVNHPALLAFTAADWLVEWGGEQNVLGGATYRRPVDAAIRGSDAPEGRRNRQLLEGYSRPSSGVL